MSMHDEAKFLIREYAHKYPGREEEIIEIWELYKEECEDTSVETAYEKLALDLLDMDE